MTNKEILADDVKVVRCKDCKYSRPLTEREKKDYVQGVVICENAEMSFDGYSARRIDDFCSYGERKGKTKMIDLVYDEKTGTWGEKKEPYITIEVATEEDYKLLEERLKKQKAKKPLGVDLHGKASGNIHKWVCPICENFLAGLKAANEKSTFLPDYCCVCGQKIDWSDIRNDKL